MTGRRKLSIYPALIALTALTTLGVWIILDPTQTPGMSTIGRWCVAAVLVTLGLVLLIGDYRDRRDRPTMTR
jgi:peptidoglycan/LPS O-acetylase OafA/YrhL